MASPNDCSAAPVDPWDAVRVLYYPAHGEGMLAFYSVEDVDVARAAEARLHQQEVEQLKAENEHLRQLLNPPPSIEIGGTR